MMPGMPEQYRLTCMKCEQYATVSTNPHAEPACLSCGTGICKLTHKMVNGRWVAVLRTKRARP